MNRRRFILLSVLAALSAVALSLVAIYDFETVVIKMLKKDLGYLKIREQDMHRYLDDARNSGYWDRMKFEKNKRAFIIAYHFLPNIGLPFQFKYFQLRATIVGNFLLSTDFFTNKMNEAADVSYVALYDPERNACQNPFSHIFYKLD